SRGGKSLGFADFERKGSPRSQRDSLYASAFRIFCALAYATGEAEQCANCEYKKEAGTATIHESSSHRVSNASVSVLENCQCSRCVRKRCQVPTSGLRSRTVGVILPQNVHKP